MEASGAAERTLEASASLPESPRGNSGKQVLRSSLVAQRLPIPVDNSPHHHQPTSCSLNRSQFVLNIRQLDGPRLYGAVLEMEGGSFGHVGA